MAEQTTQRKSRGGGSAKRLKAKPVDLLVLSTPSLVCKTPSVSEEAISLDARAALSSGDRIRVASEGTSDVRDFSLF
jgi:hypothetical protein